MMTGIADLKQGRSVQILEVDFKYVARYPSGLWQTVCWPTFHHQSTGK